MALFDRVLAIVLDSVGIGAQEDSAAYGDAGAHTLRHALEGSGIELINLRALGLYNIEGAALGAGISAPLGRYGRMSELSPGKDTTTGHWELAGLPLDRPFPVFPHGFPRELMDEFSRRTGRGWLGNEPASGTEIIERLGREHMRTGSLIVYTSADSVFQIAAHEDVVPPEELWRYCRIARELLTGELCVGRVIARPFTGKPGAFVRTGNRRDFSAMMPGDTMLDCIARAGLDVVAVGKIEDIFAHRGLTRSDHASGNTACMTSTRREYERELHGLELVNLVDFDSLYGHRRDPYGYAQALAEFDAWLGEMLPLIGPRDLIMITADHGCDPRHAGSDHTREHVPLVIYSPSLAPGPLGTRTGFCDFSATVLDALGVSAALPGKSCLGEQRGG